MLRKFSIVVRVLLALVLLFGLQGRSQAFSGRVILTGTSVAKDGSNQIITAYFSAVIPTAAGNSATGQFFLTQISRTITGTIDQAEVVIDPVTHIATGAIMHAKVGTADAYITLSYTPTHVLTYMVILDTKQPDGSDKVETLTPGNNWRPGLALLMPAT